MFDPERAASEMVPVNEPFESRTIWLVSAVRFNVVPVIAPALIDTPLIVLVVLAVIVPVRLRLPDIFVLSERVIRPDPESILINPVVDPPRVRVLPISDWIELFDVSRTKPAPVPAESVATGVSPAKPVIAKFALDVD